MKRVVLGIVLTLILVGMLGSTFDTQLFSASAQGLYGPRHGEGLDIYFYAGSDQAFAALKAGEVDFIQWSLTYEQYEDVCYDPDLHLAGHTENGMMEFDLNNNYTIQTYPGVRNPLHVKEFRRALSCMVDKQWIVNSILSGGGVVLNVPIPVNSYSWWPDCALPENYPWQYNMTKAAEQLALAGFVDLEPDGVVNYPDAWPGRTGQPNMDPLVVYVRTEDKRLDVGIYFCDQLDLLHIPYDRREGTSEVCYPPVREDRNYHIYTGGWSLGRYPLSPYNLFHSDFWFEYGSNYVTGMNESNLPNYPDYDELAHDVYYTDSIESARTAAKAAAALGWCDYVLNIPLWSYKSWWAYSRYLVGIVNMDGYGLENTFTFLNAYKVDNPATPEDESQDPIRMGTISAPKSLNPLYSSWYYDYAVLDRVFARLLSVNPYNLAIDQPWIAQDWLVESWYDPQDDEDKTKVTYWIREDVWWHAPVTGEVVRQFTAHDVEFTIWYIYAFDDCWNWLTVMDVHHTNVVNDLCIEVYFDLQEIFAVYSIGLEMPLLPKQEYEALGIPGLDPHGYYLADLDWTETFYSIGPYYPIHIVQGVGGFASLDCNPSFFLETPPLGEIDWRWYWQGTTKPRSGYYRVDIFDVVRVTAAYGTTGDGEPDPNWFPGADIDSYDLGHVGLYDLVTILVRYGECFGKP